MAIDLNSVFQPVSDRWEGLPTRDRRALSVLLVAGALLLIWFGVINPVRSWRAESAAQLEAAQATYQTLISKAPQAMAAGSNGAASSNPASLNTEMRRQANRFGLAIQSFEPDGNLLRVRIDKARYANVVRWLAALEAQGIVTEQMNMSARDQSGLVSVQASFRR